VWGALQELGFGKDRLQRHIKADEAGANRASRKEVIIRPGDTWKIWSCETVQVPESAAGRLSVRGEFILEGIVPAFGLQIDPGWQGKPFMVLDHRGDQDVQISWGQPCMSLELSSLSSPYLTEGHIRKLAKP
jgi:deoxycytidine triphosphate deaminase